MTSRLRIGSRGSQLARWQAERVAGLLRQQGHVVEIQIIKTTGDQAAGVPFANMTTKGIFIKEIEEALAAGEVDLAVHSLKDLPTDLLPSFELGAILEREDPRDALVSKFGPLEKLPKSARVGTSSLRRQAQVHHVRPDLRILPLRGNVDTRLRKLHEGEFDALLLAAAGLRRLGREPEISELLSPETMCPAAGQGALGVEIRKNDGRTRKLVEFMDHPGTRAAVLAERAVLRGLGGGCQVPIGAYAEKRDSGFRLLARVGSPDGSRMLSEEAIGDDPEMLGSVTAARLLRSGASQILENLLADAVPEQP